MLANNIWLDLSDKQVSVKQALEQCRKEYNLPENSSLVLSHTTTDEIGMKHYTYQQYIEGIKVEGCYLLVHEQNHSILSINGKLLEKGKMPSEQTILSQQQIKAKNTQFGDKDLEPIIFEHQGKYYTAYKYFDEKHYSNVYINAKTGEEIVVISVVSNAAKNGTAHTLYYGVKDIIYDNSANINTLVDSTRLIFTVDAGAYDGVNPNTIYPYTNPSSEWYAPILESVTITWASQDWWYNVLTDSKPDLYIRVKNANGVVLYESGYYEDATLPVTFNIPMRIEMNGEVYIEVLDYDGISDDSGGSVKILDILAGSYSWNNNKTQATYVIGKAYHPALDVHWGMEKVYDFYKTTFNHISYDGKGSFIVQYVNPPSDLDLFHKQGFPNQSCAFGGSGMMAYGMGDGKSCNPLVAIDIMGHEYTHLVTGANGDQNLPTSGEGGALNESFGDIMGNAVEAYALGEADWLVGAGTIITTPNHAGRSISAPKSMGGPNTYHGTNWQPITGQPNINNDQDGVHTNCGVQNFWFYLLCQGGAGYIDDKVSNGNYSVTGIGMDKAIQIVYRNLLYYITSTSTYPDSRNGSIQAAIDLYGKGSQEHQSVVNAWYAVGVGNKYETNLNGITIKAKMPSDWGATISAWTWGDGVEGHWATLKKDGKWYTYTTDKTPLNIVFVNGTTWNGDNNQTEDINISNNACIIIGNETSGKRSYTLENCPNQITVKAQMPSDWGETISAWVWNEDTEGEWVKLNKEGKWYSYTRYCQELNIIFVNGSTWTGDNNQTVDISTQYDVCYQIGTNSGKRIATEVDCSKDTDPTAIEELPSNTTPSARKILRNGQVLIQRGDKLYTLTGQEVK